MHPHVCFLCGKLSTLLYGFPVEFVFSYVSLWFFYFAGVKLMKTQKLSTKASKYKQNRARWFLLYTLLNNPSLLPYRKRALSDARANGTQTNPLKPWWFRKSLYETLVIGWEWGKKSVFYYHSHTSWCLSRSSPLCPTLLFACPDVLLPQGCILLALKPGLVSLRTQDSSIAWNWQWCQVEASQRLGQPKDIVILWLFFFLTFKLPLQNFPFSLLLFVEVWILKLWSFSSS